MGPGEFSTESCSSPLAQSGTSFSSLSPPPPACAHHCAPVARVSGVLLPAAHGRRLPRARTRPIPVARHDIPSLSLGLHLIRPPPLVRHTGSIARQVVTVASHPLGRPSRGPLCFRLSSSCPTHTQNSSTLVRSVRASMTSPPIELSYLHQTFDAVAAPVSTLHQVHRRQIRDWKQSSPTLKICRKEPAMTSTRTAGLSVVAARSPEDPVRCQIALCSASGATSHCFCRISRR